MAYATLTVGTGWLKNIELADSAAHGIVQADLTAAETYAVRKINAWASRHGYDFSASAFQSAPMIQEIAEKLGAARVIEINFARDRSNDVSLASALVTEAEQELAKLRHTGLVDSNGDRIVPDVRAVPRISNPED